MVEHSRSIEFSALRLKVASPEEIHNWSYGEVLRPETINYRTQKSEKDGLFCERIFGPSKDWECYCGKYKKIRYKGIICDKCGVEVTRSLVRRERMGHIDLATPISHIWFLRGVPSKIGLVLNLSVQSLEKVIYFANFIITKVDEELKETTLGQIKQEFKGKKKSIETEFNDKVSRFKNQAKNDQRMTEAKLEEELINFNRFKEEKLQELTEALNLAEQELKELQPLKIISESVYQDLSLKYGHVFEASIGAEAVRTLLEELDQEQLIKDLEVDIRKTRGLKKEKAARRYKLLKSFEINQIKSKWMILTALPVIPPDLRPMVPLDGGRFATSDLNDLYRRVINRNNRLKQLIELKAPEVICRNEKRMLQEAVDALIDNSARHGKTVMASTGQKRTLKSLADILKGKQGRFRQNLLGKRVDYSGRSVIVVGPNLKINQCGLPKKMALELFKPFVISQLIEKEYVHNVRSASRFIENDRSEVWDILADIIKDAYVLLNRAPTLHRLGIQAFQPILIEGKAIRIHPLVCIAFNADFDGDQMAVHVPLTEQAKAEARDIIASTANLLKPATGDPVVTPAQDIVWGSFYMTSLEPDALKDKELKNFSSAEEALLAYRLRQLKLRRRIKVRFGQERVETSVGRIIFNQILPQEIEFINRTVDKKALAEVIKQSLEHCSQDSTIKLLDDIKELSFKYLTKSGLSWGMDDVPVLQKKGEIIARAEQLVDETQNQYDAGLLTQDERYTKIIEIWTQTKNQIVQAFKKSVDKTSPVYTMIESGARGSIGQLTQIVGMKGLVTNPAGEIIELPVKRNFKEGFDVLEYFISTHGTRKGLSDTALRTANAGYLTRRLVDVSQDMVISEEDCGDDKGIVFTKQESEEVNMDLVDRIQGRFVLKNITDPQTKTVIVRKNDMITPEKARLLRKLDLKEVKVRSIISCQARKGACQKCYGWDLGRHTLVQLGTAVGIIAAQSIGEPGTQLTMRTFHTGGVAETDITQGLPRVEELFEARTPQNKAFISEVMGVVSIDDNSKEESEAAQKIRKIIGQRIIKIRYDETVEDRYEAKISNIKNQVKEQAPAVILKVKDGQIVKASEVLFTFNGTGVKAKKAGVVKIEGETVTVSYQMGKIKELIIPPGYILWVKDGNLVNPGDQLTGGSLDLQQLYKLKGKSAAQKYIIKEIQLIYASQGQKLNDKHIEIIARQMFSKVYIKKSGETQFLHGEVVDKSELEEINKIVARKKGELAEGRELLLGISKVSLSTRSFLSAASFQETARVLINAAVTGKIDWLEGLKENVIIGRLIPAGTGFQGRKK